MNIHINDNDINNNNKNNIIKDQNINELETINCELSPDIENNVNLTLKKKVFENIKNNKKTITIINKYGNEVNDTLIHDLNHNIFNYNENEQIFPYDNSDLSDSDSLNETNKGSNNSYNDVFINDIFINDNLERDKYKESEKKSLNNTKTKSINLNNNYTNDNKIQKVVYKKLNYRDVENKIDKYYFDINHKYSSALDILASYLKGQKIIYMESKHYSEQQLNRLMMPAILLSTSAIVIGSVIKDYDYSWGVVIISIINGCSVFSECFIASISALVKYLFIVKAYSSVASNPACLISSTKALTVAACPNNFLEVCKAVL